jgi:hypothetical protein
MTQRTIQHIKDTYIHKYVKKLHWMYRYINLVYQIVSIKIRQNSVNPTRTRPDKCRIILASDQLDAQILCFIISLLQSSTCFEQRRAHHEEVKLY